MSNKKSALCVAGLALAMGSTVHADTGVYIGARAGIELKDRFIYPSAPDVEADTLYGGVLGWNFSDYWGVEVGYNEIGETVGRGVPDAGFTLDGDLATAGVTYRQSLGGDLEFISGLGAFDLSEDGTMNTIAGPRPIDHDDTGAYAEVGARYRFGGGPFAVRASYQWFDFEDGNDGTPWVGVELGF